MELSQRRASWVRERKRERRRFGIALGITVFVFLLCLCFRFNAYAYPDKFVPAEYGKSLWLALRLLVSRLLHTPLWDQRQQAIDALGSVLYYGALAQLKTTAMALVSGAGLAISGAIFQTAYRNPMASPNILGATAGVSLGNVLVVLVYSTAAYDHILLRYGYCYGFTALCVALVLLLGYLAGDRRGSCGVLEMVMAGAIVSQALNVVTSYIMYNLEDQDLLLYEEIKLGTYLDTSLSSMLIFFGTMALALLPVLLTRYRLNVLGLDGTESAALGLRCGPYRLMAQLCGVLMVTCAMIHCGEAGMLAMVIPYLVRQTVGASFHQVCVYSALAGGVLMMLCRLASSFLLIAEAPLPVSFLINLCLAPVFLVILAKQGRQTDAA